MMIDEVANLYGPGLASEYAGKEGWKPIEPGDVCWEDINGDNKINGLDREVVGNIFPKVTGGFSSTLSWKGISLYARFDYALGHTLYNDLAARTLGQYQGAFNIITEVKICGVKIIRIQTYRHSIMQTNWPKRISPVPIMPQPAVITTVHASMKKLTI